jgi:deoxyribodipyrimidine photo-lyase
MPSAVTVVWFRRDLRLGDNPALVEALAASRSVVPLFVWDPRLVSASGAPRVAFLVGCLNELNQALGGRLVLRTGDPVKVVAGVAADAGAEVVWCAEDFGPYGTTRDRAVFDALAALGVELKVIGSPYSVAPGTLLTGAEVPYQVFTPFSRAWFTEGWDDPLDPPKLAKSAITTVPGEPVPDGPSVAPSLPHPGEAGAWRCAERFFDEAIAEYDAGRDRPGREGTSRLSPYLRFGCIHPRQLLARLDLKNADHRRFATELCWREFYADVLFHRPETARSAYRNQWLGDAVNSGPGTQEYFRAWSEGMTGYPIVDAGMRQLAGEGWMHNRVRMIVASFLIKDLHQDWTAGARWFMRHLVDGDLASNQLNWQWVAGTGTDAAPYFRIFNPVTQGMRFDPEGEYIRRWVPELADLDAASIHEPWKLAGNLFEGTNGYPQPIVDHDAERRATLALYAAAKPSGGR